MCAVSPGLADSLGCKSGESAHEFYISIPGEQQPLTLRRCPLAWLRDSVSWPFVRAVQEARAYMDSGNLVAFADEPLTAVFRDCLNFYASEVASVQEERRKRLSKRHGR